MYWSVANVLLQSGFRSTIDSPRHFQTSKGTNTNNFCVNSDHPRRPQTPLTKFQKIQIQLSQFSHNSPCRVVYPALTHCNNSRPLYELFQPFQQVGCKTSSLFRVTPNCIVHPPILPSWLNFTDPPVSRNVEVGNNPSHFVATNFLTVPGKPQYHKK